MNSTMGMKTTNACSGCRILQMGCHEKCILKTSIQWIPSEEDQANATIFLAGFYGRAGLFRLLQASPEQLRPETFLSLLFEACGRVVDPVGGQVALLKSMNWNQCEAAVDAVFKVDPSLISQVQQVGDPSAATSSLDVALAPVRSVFKFHPLGVCHAPNNPIKNKAKFKRYANPNSTLRFFGGALPTHPLCFLKSYGETSETKEIPIKIVAHSLATPTTLSVGLDLDLKLGLPINKD